MKIGILTQPLHANYGGILQNYALQQVLKRMGHEVWTIDYNNYSWFDWLDNVCRVCVLKILGREAHFMETPYERTQKEKPLRYFAEQKIQLTQPRTKKIKRSVITNYAFDAMVVGSDQVWRPKYNNSIEDCFLNFAAGLQIKRVAYAASFGTEEWEFTLQQTERCANLVKFFDAISVREASGLLLCKQYLGVQATHVLDPTLLLDAEDYAKLCAGIPKQESVIYAYILDENDRKKEFIEEFARRKGLPYIIKRADGAVKAEDSIELWLSYFRDASFVITDSFHGSVFSIIFNKDFYVFENKKRGNSRFDSLLGLLDLKSRMLCDTLPKNSSTIDWNIVNEKREKEIIKSKQWLKQNL